MTAPFTVAHLFCGAGGGALGMRRAGLRCVGAFDNNATACASFEKLVGYRPTCIDLALAEPAAIAAGCTERPHVVFLSAPCRGMSGCLPEKMATSDHYQQMNALTMRGVWLVLEAWDLPPPMIVFENVPRIRSRGKAWLDRIISMLRNYGYAVTLSSHDCGEIGGLAQHRRRFLLVARHTGQLGEYVRVPQCKSMLSIGDVLGSIPQPRAVKLARGVSIVGGRMHTLPSLSAMNWLRLALIPAGDDFHALPAAVRLTERNARQNGGFGVESWDESSHAVLGHHTVRDTWGSLADPRLGTDRYPASLGVRDWGGAHARNDSACSVVDPRVGDDSIYRGSFGVQDWSVPSKTIRGHMNARIAPSSVADPRIDCTPRAGAYGVESWAQPSHTIVGHHKHDNSPGSVADPRVVELVLDGAIAATPWPSIEIVGPRIDLASKANCYLVIRASDNCWHRPFTTLELAALQGLPVYTNATWLELAGTSHGVWRKQIGDMVPPPAAESIGRQIVAALTAARDGGMILSNDDVWVREIGGDPIVLTSSMT